MHLKLLTLLPAIVVIIWATSVKFQKHKYLDATLISIGGVIAVINFFFAHQIFTGNIPSVEFRCVQQFLSTMIVPLAYLYFSNQVGRKWNNATNIILWLLVLVSLTPNFVIPVDGILISNESETHIRPMTINIMRQGKIDHTYYTADFIILIQSLFTLIRMGVIYRLFHRYQITITYKVRHFMLWWFLVIVFVFFTSLNDTHTFSQPFYNWLYHIGYSALVLHIYILFALDFDLRPFMHSLTEDEEKENFEETETATDTPVVAEKKESQTLIVDDFDAYIVQSEYMAKRVRKMMEERAFLRSELNVDEVITSLGTNRTYFARMMKTEFGCTFYEYLTRQRIEHAKVLLSNHSLSIQDVALSCGFSDSSSFSRRFHQVCNLTPSQYRRAINAKA